MFLDRLKARIRQFGADTRGHVTLEAMIVLPVLLWIFGAGWVYFDAFRQQAVNQKANYVIGDMLSREIEPVDAAYITNARKLLRELTRSTGTDSDLRVTVVQYDADDAAWSGVWSERRGNQPKMNASRLQDYTDRLPTGGHGDQLIMVETWDLHRPVLSVGLSDFEIRSYSFTRPRFAPRLLFDDGAAGSV